MNCGASTTETLPRENRRPQRGGIGYDRRDQQLSFPRCGNCAVCVPMTHEWLGRRRLGGWARQLISQSSSRGRCPPRIPRISTLVGSNRLNVYVLQTSATISAAQTMRCPFKHDSYPMAQGMQGSLLSTPSGSSLEMSGRTYIASVPLAYSKEGYNDSTGPIIY